MAVLPFVLNTDGESEEYLKNGMTESLIKELSKVDQLTVIGLASTRIMAAAFNPSNLLITNEINGIDYFIFGSMVQELNRINVQIKLKNRMQER